MKGAGRVRRTSGSGSGDEGQSLFCGTFRETGGRIGSYSCVDQLGDSPAFNWTQMALISLIIFDAENADGRR